MDISHLEHFSKVYECRNYTHASSALFVSRQALQQTVRSLEKELGGKLFTQQARGLEPTDLANKLYSSAQKVIEDYLEFVRSLSADKNDEQRPIRRGTIANIHDVMTEEEARECHLKNYDPSGTHISASCDELRRLVANGELDCAHLYGNTSFSPGFETIVTASNQNLYLVTRKDDPLASHHFVTVKDLRNVPFVGMGLAFDIDKSLARLCEKAGFSLNISYTSPSSASVLSKVAMGAGVSYYLVDHINHPASQKLICVPFDEPSLSWDAYTIFRKETLAENPAYRLILESIRAAEESRRE